MRVTIVKFSDGDDPMYFMNGKRDHSIEGDAQLLDELVGHTVEYVETFWIEPVDNDNPEPWEDIWYVEREEQLYSHFATYPELVGK